MYAVQFEADIYNVLLRVPSIYKEIDHAHVIVTLTLEDDKQKLSKIDFSSYVIKAFDDTDPLEYQRQARDEW